MLYLIPTPIGNLGDITLRALETLKKADLIVCEDTRHTKKLLDHYGISKNLDSFHDHSPAAKAEKLAQQMQEGTVIAYVTDAGTPLVSDPGFPLVRAAIQKGIRVESLPGAFAGVTALAASGLPAESFSFFGFLPQKTGARQNKLRELADREETLIFYESPFRAAKSLDDMAKVFGDREAVVARELTKKFEEYRRGLLSELAQSFSAKESKGEFVILVAGKGRKRVL